MKNRLKNTFNSYSNSCFPINYLPLLKGICIQRGDAWSWVLAISGQWDSETPRRTPGAEIRQINSSRFPVLAYPPVIACRRLALKVAESVSSVAELIRTSILDNSTSA